MKYLHSYNEDFNTHFISTKLKGVIDRLNNMYNTIGFSFGIETNDYEGFFIRTDMLFVKDSLSYTILMNNIKEEQQTSPIYLCKAVPTAGCDRELRAVEINFGKGHQKATDGYIRMKKVLGTSNIEQHILDDVKNILIRKIKLYKNFSASGWPRKRTLTIDYLYRLLLSYVDETNFIITDEDAIEIYNDIIKSDKQFTIFNNIKRDFPKLWGMFKKIKNNTNLDTASGLGEAGF